MSIASTIGGTAGERNPLQRVIVDAPPIEGSSLLFWHLESTSFGHGSTCFRRIYHMPTRIAVVCFVVLTTVQSEKGNITCVSCILLCSPSNTIVFGLLSVSLQGAEWNHASVLFACVCLDIRFSCPRVGCDRSFRSRQGLHYHQQRCPALSSRSTKIAQTQTQTQQSFA